MNNFSDSLIEEYDLFGKVFPFHDELQNTISTSLENYFPDKIKEYTFLDIGAGYGFTTSNVAKLFPNTHFIINEYDPELLSRADKYLSGISRENKLGDIEQIIKDIPSHSVDAVYTAWVIHNFPKQKRATLFKEIARILKTGGVFVYLEKIGNPGSERLGHLTQAIIDLAPFYTKYQRPDLYIDWVRHNLRDEEPDLLFSDQEHKTLLKENHLLTKCVKHILLEKVFITIKN